MVMIALQPLRIVALFALFTCPLAEEAMDGKKFGRWRKSSDQVISSKMQGAAADANSHAEERDGAEVEEPW